MHRPQSRARPCLAPRIPRSAALPAGGRGPSAVRESGSGTVTAGRRSQIARGGIGYFSMDVQVDILPHRRLADVVKTNVSHATSHLYRPSGPFESDDPPSAKSSLCTSQGARKHGASHGHTSISCVLHLRMERTNHQEAGVPLERARRFPPLSTRAFPIRRLAVWDQARFSCSGRWRTDVVQNGSFRMGRCRGQRASIPAIWQMRRGW